MLIKDVVCAAGSTGYFNLDLAALKAGAKRRGVTAEGEPLTAGYARVIEPGEALSIMLVLENGAVAHGDCMDVILSGAAGRDPRFRVGDHLDLVNTTIRDRLVGADVCAFRSLAREVGAIEVEGRRLHTAVRYGVSQALLQATALARHLTITEVVAEEYGCAMANTPVPILSMCGTDEREQVDKMILKRADIFPHAEFIHVDDHLGPDGHRMVEYVAWVRERIRTLGEPGYRPTIHIDVYGTIGERFSMDIARIADFFSELERAADGLDLMVETPFIAATQDAQIEAFLALRAALRDKGCGAQLIVDEWCNDLADVRRFADAGAADYIQVKAPDMGGIDESIEALLHCKAAGVGAYLGGSGNETDQSARISAEVALGVDADILIGKPGLGVDEALMIERNAMNRALALIARRREG